ncbi:hypothetical protein [Pectobacterium phage PcCB7V]|nr:hypothetical protein [Pectobacterium phage PcCB7V]
MSGMRLTVGIIAQLAKSVGDYNQPEHQALTEKLEDMKSSLKLTYGGDMIVYIAEDKRTDYNGPGLILVEEDIMSLFEQELALAGLFVFQGTPKVFVDHWYDGADANHIDITLEQAGYEKEWEDE